MKRANEPGGVRKWAALLAVGFCGYLTLATSVSAPDACPPEEATTLERTFTRGEQLRSWRLTAVSSTSFTSWHVQVSPPVTLTYVPPKGAEVRIVSDPVFEAASDAGANTDDGSAPSASSGSSQTVLPPDHVLVGECTLTVVCGGDPSLCEDVRFDVGIDETGAKTLTLEASAQRSNCELGGQVTDLRLEPTLL